MEKEREGGGKMRGIEGKWGRTRAKKDERNQGEIEGERGKVQVCDGKMREKGKVGGMQGGHGGEMS